MKIIKEDLDNLERVQGRQTVQGIMMKDAEEQSKKLEDNFKEVAGDPQDLKKKKAFLGAEKQPKPKDAEVPKAELEESLFEDIDNLSEMPMTADEAIEYWKKEHNNDPVLRMYDSFLDWYEDSKMNGYIKENCRGKLTEAGGVKDGVLYSTFGDPLTFWDKIYAELDGNLTNDNDYTKLVELPVKVKNKYQEISVTNDGNIKVFTDSKDKLQHAIDVAEHYGLQFDIGTTSGFNDPNKAFYCTVVIPEEKQDEYVTYDARKMGDDSKEVA